MLAIAVAAILASAAGCGRGTEPGSSSRRAAAEPAKQPPPASPEPATPPTNPQATGAGFAQPANAATPPIPGEATAPGAAPATDRNPALLDPSLATEQAPARYTVKLETSKGEILIDVTRAWSPHGADRFYNLVKIGYFTDVAFFRVLEGFMAQAGLHGDGQVNRAWRSANIPDDPATEHNIRGMVSFATAGPNTRSNQFFINFGDNRNLDGMGFSPFGRVRDMRAVDALYSGYGEGAPRGRGPNQSLVQQMGNTYLRAEFPNLDYIQRATIMD